MKTPRDLSGHELVAVLCRRWGYVKVGNHIILQTQEPSPHRIAVPAHKSLRWHAEWNSAGRCQSQGRQAILDSL
jgi:hypothetical protein